MQKNIDMAKTTSDALKNALTLPNGARFYRCALQVNPFAYHGRHGKPNKFSTEDEYNSAIVQACLDNGIEAIAVTDHYRISDSWTLIRAARSAGIFVFGGFEAASKDGIHFLCIYDPDKDDRLERFIGQLGVHHTGELSPNGDKDCTALLQCVREQGGIAIAAHVCADNGLLKNLEGQPRINAWKSQDLYACALPGGVEDCPQGHRDILKNTDPGHKRERAVAIVNASDVNAPEDLANNKSSSHIKMSEISVEGLRQAFLDPDSRIRLNHDNPPDPHTEFVAMTWEGGFLDGTKLHLNGNLNVLIGGRGTGKSTIIESLRYVLALDPLGEEATKSHLSVIKHVLKAGTKISLLVRSHHPVQHEYTIERTIPNPPVIKNEAGEVLNLQPRQVVPGVEVFGQHEISELTKSREKLTLLLERFVDRGSTEGDTQHTLVHDLETSRSTILSAQREIKRAEERLAQLPGLEETQKRFAEAGLEQKLKEKSLLLREERLFSDISGKITPFKTMLASLRSSLPIDHTFVSEDQLKELPHADIIKKSEATIVSLSQKLEALAKDLEQATSTAATEVAAIQNEWDTKKQAIEAAYQAKLRELQKDKIDGDEFIQLRRKIEELQPLKQSLESQRKELASQKTARRALIDRWENHQAEEYRRLERAAKKVSKRLSGRVRVEVTMAGNREPLERLLKTEIGGNLSTFIERLNARESLSLRELADACRAGRDELITKYQVTPASAEKVAAADPEIFMKLEELELPATTKIELNTAAEGDTPNWQTLEGLSTGQKATAVLLLLLLESGAPLIVDQPEDDLDNRFITDGVVPTMKREKRKRQFVFSTHNANIPVLGDAELIVGLSAGSTSSGRVDQSHMGSIDRQPVREMVEEILEGGKTAFEMRRQKYGF